MQGRYEDRLLRVVQYIHDNPSGDLSLDRLADVAAMSRFHWHRVYHAMTGETCAQAVRRVRLHLAASLLVSTDLALGKIATRVAYPDPASFNRAFSSAFGLTPGAFRERGIFTPQMLQINPGDYPMHPIEIETHAPKRLAALPHQGAYTDVGKAFESLSAIFSARDIWSHARGMVGVYYDDPSAVAEADLKSHAGVVVDDTLTLDDPMEEVLVPGGRYAVMKYVGPYAGLAAAYQYLYGVWLPQSGHEIGDHPPIEIYHNGPQDTAPKDLRTDVCVSLKG